MRGRSGIGGVGEKIEAQRRENADLVLRPHVLTLSATHLYSSLCISLSADLLRHPWRAAFSFPSSQPILSFFIHIHLSPP